jgi:glycosyltransferase involved in cell wall biosynthesis
LPEIIGANERGLICDAINTEELSTRIARLLRDAALRMRLGMGGAEWVRNVCGMRRYLRNIVDVYERVLVKAQREAEPVGGAVR